MRIIGSICALCLSLSVHQLGLCQPLPQGSGTIVLEEVVLRAVSESPEDPVIRIEVWRDGRLLHSESACGSQSCSTDLSHLSAGAILAIGGTESGGQFSEELVLE